MASIIDGLTYQQVREMNSKDTLNFEELTETEICRLLDNAIEQFEVDNSDENEALINACLMALDRFPQFSPKLDDEKILSGILAAQKKHRTVFPARKSKVLISLATTIAVLFSLSAVVYASGVNLFDIFFNRTSETLNIDISNQSSSQASSETEEISSQPSQFTDKEYTDLETFVNENPNAQLPPYIPEGMVFTYGQAVIDSESETYNISFYDSMTEENISISIDIANGDFAATMGLEIDNEYSEEYVVSGITHYIESNYDDFSVVWFDGNESYYLGSGITLQEIKKIINSYYGG